MLGLPKTTEISKQLSKKAIYTKFQMNTQAKNKIDADISRISIVNEVSTANVHIAEGKLVKTFFVMLVVLKKKDFDEKNIITLSKLIPQNILLILEYENEAQLAIYHTKLIQTHWQPKDTLTIELKGLTLDTVWENIVVQVGDIEIVKGNTLNEQIEIDERKIKIDKEIVRLEKLARSEKQPKKKYELVQEIKKLEEQLKE